MLSQLMPVLRDRYASPSRRAILAQSDSVISSSRVARDDGLAHGHAPPRSPAAAAHCIRTEATASLAPSFRGPRHSL